MKTTGLGPEEDSLFKGWQVINCHRGKINKMIDIVSVLMFIICR